MRINCVPVDMRCADAVQRLHIAPEQEGFVESVAQCLCEAQALTLWRPVGLYAGSELVGFAMYGLWENEGADGRVWLDRLLIDRRFQGRGYGRAALTALLERLAREYPQQQKIYLSVVAQNHTAIRLYMSAGFRFTGETDSQGERIMVLTHTA